MATDDENKLGYYALYLAIVRGYTPTKAFAALGAPVERPDARRNHHKKEPALYQQMSLEDIMEEQA